MPNHPPIREILEQALLDSREQRDRNGALYVTDTRYVVGGGCPRQLKLELLGKEKKEPTPGILWMFDRAEKVEDALIEILLWHLEHWDLESQKSVDLLGGVRGRIDLFLNDPKGKQYIIEIKSCRGNKFPRLDANGPQQDHVIQLQCYGLAYPEALLGLLYADREGQNGFRYFPIEQNHAAALDALRKVQEVARSEEIPPVLRPNVSITKNVGPDSVKVKIPWQCAYCPFLDMSCDGAIPKGKRPPENKIIGKLHKKWVDEEGGAFEYTHFARKQRLTSVVIEAIEEKMNDG